MKKVIEKVLDKGEIEFIDSLGSDLTVVNSARVSFGKQKVTLTRADVLLMKYLKEHKHFSPFRHIQVQFRIKAPEFVTRQLFRHLVGVEITSTYPTKDMPWNEQSHRYIKVDEYYVPETWRRQSEYNKQGSDGLIDNQSEATEKYNQAMKNAFDLLYNHLIELGIAKEQARIVLPLSIYTEFYWTASFQAVANFLELRLADDAQWEIRQYANALKKIMLKLYPITTRIWFQPDLSTDELMKFIK